MTSSRTSSVFNWIESQQAQSHNLFPLSFCSSKKYSSHLQFWPEPTWGPTPVHPIYIFMAASVAWCCFIPLVCRHRSPINFLRHGNAIHCRLKTAHHTVHMAHGTLQCALYTLHNELDNLQITVWTPHIKLCKLDTALLTEQTSHCTVNCAHFTLHFAHVTLHNAMHTGISILIFKMFKHSLYVIINLQGFDTKIKKPRDKTTF